MRVTGRWGMVAVLALAAAIGAGRTVRADEGADAVKACWDEILKAATAGDEAKVKSLLEKTVLSEDDFKSLFADEAKAKELSGKYAEKYAKRWVADAKGLITRIKEKGADTVRVTELSDPKEQTGNDKKIIALLKPGTKMYCVRIGKGDVTKGLRYDCQFVVGGQCKAGLKLGSLVGGTSDKPAGGGDKPDKPADPGDGGDPK